MNHRLPLLLCLLGLGLTSGCASMSKDECLTADWYAIGFEDGAKGFDSSAVARHRKACAKAGVTANFRAWEKGRQEGVRQFCTPARGYDVGHSGGNYNGVCPADLEDAFLAAYGEGRELWTLEQGVRDIEQQLRRTESQLARAQERLNEVENELVNGDTTPARRQELLDETRETAQLIGELEARRDGLLFDLGTRQERLNAYLATNY